MLWLRFLTFCMFMWHVFLSCVVEAPQFEDEWLQRTRQFAPRQDHNAVNYEQRSRHRPVDNRRYQWVVKWIVSVDQNNGWLSLSSGCYFLKERSATGLLSLHLAQSMPAFSSVISLVSDACFASLWANDTYACTHTCRFTALFQRHLGEPVLSRRRDFLEQPLDFWAGCPSCYSAYNVKALQENQVVWSSFILQTWYQHPMSNQQCQSTEGNTVQITVDPKSIVACSVLWIPFCGLSGSMSGSWVLGQRAVIN